MIRFEITAKIDEITEPTDFRVGRAMQLVQHLGHICVLALSRCTVDHDRITAVFAVSNEETARAFEDVINSLTCFTITRLP